MTEWFDLDDADEKAIATFMSRVAELRIPDPESRVPGHGLPAPALRRHAAARHDRHRAGLPAVARHRRRADGGVVAAGLLIYWSLPYLFF